MLVRPNIKRKTPSPVGMFLELYSKNKGVIEMSENKNANKVSNWKNNLATLVNAKNPKAVIIAAPLSMGKTQQLLLTEEVKRLQG